MEDTIEICSGCGKMPRPIDYLNGQFLCSRCGNAKTMMVGSEEYEEAATQLDTKFHKGIIESKIAVSREEAVSPSYGRRSARRTARGASRKPKKARKPAKKAKKAKPSKKKKTVRKAAKKKVKRTPAKKAKKKAAKKRRR